MSVSEAQPDRYGVFHYANVYRSRSGWWLPYGSWWIRSTEKDPILIRAKKLDGIGAILLQGLGSLVGAVTTIDDSQGSAELASGSLLMQRSGQNPGGDMGWTSYPPSDIAIKGPGCYGFQVDGTMFSYSIIVKFVP